MVTYLPQWINLSSYGCWWSLIWVNAPFLFLSTSVWHVNKPVRLYLDLCRTASLSLLSSSNRDGPAFSSIRFGKLHQQIQHLWLPSLLVRVEKVQYFMQFLLRASEFCEMCKLGAVEPLWRRFDTAGWKKVTWSPGEICLFQPLLHLKQLIFLPVFFVCLFFMVGACWSSLRSPEGSQLLLGGWRLHLQVFRGDSDRPLPQSHQAQPRHPMDHKACAQAQRDARPDICRKEEPRPGQGPQVPPDHRRLPPRCLEEAQHPAAAPLPLGCAACLYIQKINILFMVAAVSFFTIYIRWYFQKLFPVHWKQSQFWCLLRENMALKGSIDGYELGWPCFKRIKCQSIRKKLLTWNI